MTIGFQVGTLACVPPCTSLSSAILIIFGTVIVKWKVSVAHYGADTQSMVRQLMSTTAVQSLHARLHAVHAEMSVIKMP